MAGIKEEYARPDGSVFCDGKVSRALHEGPAKRVDFRKALRNFPSVLVSASEAGRAGTPYQLNDITETGVGISGIVVQVGDVKTIIVLGDETGLVVPFEFEAECRWTGTQEPHGDPCAGFRITRISNKDYEFLRQFIGQYTFAVES